MNAFLSGFIAIILLFSFCFTVSACFYKILMSKKSKKQSRKKPSEVVYYIDAEQPKPKPKRQTIAIKGTLLNKAEIEKIMKDNER